jgi:hypothetical protein
LWEVGFGNGVRKIHSEFNEVPKHEIELNASVCYKQLIRTHMYTRMRLNG